MVVHNKHSLLLEQFPVRWYISPLAQNSEQCYIFPPSAIQNPEQLLYFPPSGTGSITVMHNPKIRFRIHTSVIHPSLWYAIQYEGAQYTFPPSGTVLDPVRWYTFPLSGRGSCALVHIPSLCYGILYNGTHSVPRVNDLRKYRSGRYQQRSIVLFIYRISPEYIPTHNQGRNIN